MGDIISKNVKFFVQVGKLKANAVQFLRHLKYSLMLLFLCAGLWPASANTLPVDTMNSVVSVLPVWPGRPQGGTGAPSGTAPEGSGVVVGQDGLIATAWHVVEPANRIDVRLFDGRILPATVVGYDAASDIALLRISTTLTPFKFAKTPNLAAPVCAIANAFGLDLSVTCGVVSAVNVSHAGFNTVEDFIQTDASANPGGSGGALVDENGHLVGMLSAIFASRGDTNIGVNYAVSAKLLKRVVDDLRDDGKVDYVSAGWILARLEGDIRSSVSGALVHNIVAGGPAESAGIIPDDIITEIEGRNIKKPRDIVASLATLRVGDSVTVSVMRNQELRELTLIFDTINLERESQVEPEVAPPASRSTRIDCAHPQPVCISRQAVFPIESFDPVASAVRIGPDLLVTNRHVIGNRKTANLITPTGPIVATVVASTYRGDLALLKAEGLPKQGLILRPEEGQTSNFASGTYFAVGADIARQEIRVFEEGKLILPPANGAAFGRLHVTSRMQPGVSGGALVNEQGKLAGIAVGGGEGRYEALPVVQITRLLAGTKQEEAESVQETLGTAFVRCVAALDAARDAPRGQPHDGDIIAALSTNCLTGENPGQLLDAGRILGIGRANEEAIMLHEASVARVPNSINARVSLLVSLQLGGRFPEMLPHARWLLGIIPDDSQALRFAIQSGVWGGDKKLAETAYKKLLKADPRQAQAARRFIDQAPPAPPRR